MEEVRAEDTTFNEDYKLPLSGPKMFILGSFLVAFAFAVTFPVDKIFHHYLATALKANANCQLQFKNYEFGLFLPNIQFNEVAIPNNCLTNTQKTLVVDKMRVSFGGVNFSPLGVVVNLGLQVGKNELDVKASSDGNTHVVKMEDQKLLLAPLALLLSQKLGITMPDMRGKAKIDFHLKSQGDRLEIFDLNIDSKDFKLPAQSLMGFVIPDLDFKTLKVETKGKGKQILVEKVTAGDKDSPLYINTRGSIALNDRVINRSNLDMEVELRFSEQILEQYSIFKMVLAQFSKGNNTYKLKVSGNMSAPRTQPL